MNVEQFATELKVAPALLVEQLKAAGVTVAGISDVLSDQDKSRLLDYLRSKRGAEQPKSKITLTRKSTSEIRTADSSGRTRTVQVEVRKKRTLIRREVGHGEGVPLEKAEEHAESLMGEEFPEALAEPVVELVVEAPVDVLIEPEIVVAFTDPIWVEMIEPVIVVALTDPI